MCRKDPSAVCTSFDVSLLTHVKAVLLVLCSRRSRSVSLPKRVSEPSQISLTRTLATRSAHPSSSRELPCHPLGAECGVQCKLGSSEMGG
jgi:hypothetical protein